MTPASADRELRAEVEHFLFEEAELLDSWQLNEWVELFTEDAISHVPALDDPNRDAAQSVFLVADDLARIRSRVRQLTGGTAWAENPRSQTRRDRKSTRLNSSHGYISYAVFCLKKKKKKQTNQLTQKKKKKINKK